ncbi:MAG TPA: TetR/AcrR family transcriptional regulator [Aestuariivirga sp.]|nr:TetR/AcrR family transcriptional regulator [Aestuariivirga sp.]
MNKKNTSQQILDIAQQLVQTRGFNAFSYADIAEALHVTKASLHYHFTTKADLGVGLIERYDRRIEETLAGIDRSGAGAAEKIRAYVRIYSEVLRDDRMCMCGMLAAEFATLPKPMRSALDRYFDRNDQWLAAVLEEGRRQGALKFSGSSADMAQFLIGSLEGAMMLARSHGGMARFDAATRRLLAELGA